MPEITADDHIKRAQALIYEAAEYPVDTEESQAFHAAAHTHAAIAQAILANTDRQQRALVKAWRGIAERYTESGNREYALGVSDCEADLREVLRHNQ